MYLPLALGFAMQKPNLAYRWVYLQTNFMVAANVDKAEVLLERAKKAGYNGFVIADTKLDFLGTVGEPYYKNAKRFAAKAKSLGIDVIPVMASVGWADGLLHNNPSLIEGQQVRGAEFVAQGTEAVFSPDANAVYRNGGFEQGKGDQAVGFGFQDGIGSMTFLDSTVKHSGQQSLKMTNLNGNCRIMQSVPVIPHRQYHFSVWAKTQGLKSQFEIKALDSKTRSLADQDPRVKPDQDWTEHHLTFNSGESTKANLYMGFWGGNKGTIWLDDAKLEEVGLLNVIRRPTTPVRVRGESGTQYTEGKDFETISDPRAGTVPWVGGYEVFHAAPSIRLKSGGRIRQGERLKVDFNHALLLNDGKTSLCLNAPGTAALLAQQAQEIEKLWSPRGFFLGHDEIRSGGTDDDCLASGRTPGQTLAKNIADCVGYAEKAHPGAETYVWNDMFDPFHNAVDSYYLTGGSLKGAWEGVPKRTIIVNWYYNARMKNMPFFADRGHSQILAGYYDHNPTEIRDWLRDAAGIKGIAGVMYTTWVDNYRDLETFAKAAWGG